MSDYANGLVKVVVFFGVIYCVPATTPAHNVFCYSAVAHTGTPEQECITGALPPLPFERVGNGSIGALT